MNRVCLSSPAILTSEATGKRLCNRWMWRHGLDGTRNRASRAYGNSSTDKDQSLQKQVFARVFNESRTSERPS